MQKVAWSVHHHDGPEGYLPSEKPTENTLKSGRGRICPTSSRSGEIRVLKITWVTPIDALAFFKTLIIWIERHQERRDTHISMSTGPSSEGWNGMSWVCWRHTQIEVMGIDLRLLLDLSLLNPTEVKHKMCFISGHEGPSRTVKKESRRET